MLGGPDLFTSVYAKSLDTLDTGITGMFTSQCVGTLFELLTSWFCLHDLFAD